ncbi:ABC transporter permease [Rhodococcus chondri]|uniref:ABC transporter permease n=1 Tax=Rhodococcus chondri TaxID=3065941 RepID=A0ABU7JQT6_9NOCA|nr:ABC transporter permease [Rhodococcus sp. CC-R104]MEE2032185.1 ABC transporter permease [Rhodococcus sp. CC-R104]
MTVHTKGHAAHGTNTDVHFSLPDRRAGTHRRAEPSAVNQWSALTSRTLRTMARSGEFVLAVLAPFVFGLGFYLPLKFVMQLQGIDYAQFLMPIIVLQSMAFTAISAAQLAAQEAATGLTTRLQTMPVFAVVPMMSRMASSLVRSVLSLIAAIGFGYLIGFRFSAGLGQAALFGATALVVSLVLCLGADAIGSLSKSPEATSQALTLPQLILGMLSCGFVPEEGFPEWIRPFVRNQPISQFSFAMRDMAQDGVTWEVFFPTLLWLIGLSLVCVPLAVWANTRRG